MTPGISSMVLYLIIIVIIVAVIISSIDTGSLTKPGVQ